MNCDYSFKFDIRSFVSFLFNCRKKLVEEVCRKVFHILCFEMRNFVWREVCACIILILMNLKKL